MKKIVLGFSGGLDTTFCARYLSEEAGYEVHSITVNTGGFSNQELQDISKHAYKLGVTSHTNIDATETYYSKILKYLIFGNVLKNNTYPLSVSAERLIQAVEIARHANHTGAEAVAHGSTGAGNDQVRFDMVFRIHAPQLTILTPIRDLKLSREEEIEKLRKWGVEMNYEKAAYSINKGLWGTSVGGRETLGSNGVIPENAWPVQVSKTEPETLKVSFKQGEPSAINDIEFSSPVDLIRTLHSIAAPFGIGRDIHTGDTVIGIKGRVAFEASAPLLLIKSHHLLEKHVLTKWQLNWKDSLALFYGNHLHEGQLLDPVMRDIETFFLNTQKFVTGSVYLTLFPYRFVLNGIESDHDLMNPAFGSYGEMNRSWTGEDVKGFSAIASNQISIFHKVNGIIDEI